MGGSLALSKPKVIGIWAVAMLVAYSFGRYAQPARVVEHTVTVTQEVHDAKSSDALVTSSSSSLVVVVHRNRTTTRKPDGTVVEQNQDVVVKESAKQAQTEHVAETSTHVAETNTVDHTKMVEYLKPQWAIGASVEVDLSRLSATPQYGGFAARRIMGPVWAGVGLHEIEGAGTISGLRPSGFVWVEF